MYLPTARRKDRNDRWRSQCGFPADVSEADVVPSGELEQMLGYHRLWLESQHEQGKRAGLHRAFLKDADLEAAGSRPLPRHAAGGTASECELSRADLREANLETENPRGLKLIQAKIRGARLIQACLL